jgi:hypothetical protein
MKAWVLISILLLSACSGYSHKTQDIRHAMQYNQPKLALQLVDQGIEDGKDRWLLKLEKGTILQSLGKYKESIAIFDEIDQKIEILDYTSSTPQALGKMIFADDSGEYRPFAFEKLLVNLFNLLNHLYLGEINEAKIEAKRIEINLAYFEGKKQSISPNLHRFLSFFNALTFSLAGDVALAKPYLSELDDQLQQQLQLLLQGKALILVSRSGQIPYKIEKTVPIGMAVNYVHHSQDLSEDERRSYHAFYLSNSTVMLRYPDLFVPNQSLDAWQIQLNDQSYPPFYRLNLKEQMLQAFEEVKGKIMLSAMSRMITRTAIGSVSGAVGKSVKGKAGGIIGLVGLITEVSMAAADTPDTRSWTTLPAVLDFYLIPVDQEAQSMQLTWQQADQRKQKQLLFKQKKWLAYFLNEVDENLNQSPKSSVSESVKTEKNKNPEGGTLVNPQDSTAQKPSNALVAPVNTEENQNEDE